jgi:cytochrome c oxidase subunit II
MLVVIGVIVSAVTTAIALLVGWLPDQAAEQRDRIDFIFWLTTAICIGIFAIVASVSIYSVWKFRVKPDDESDGPPIHGHTGIEIAWTAVPTVLVTIIIVASAIVLARNEATGADALRVKVTAQQFAWSFEYPNGVTSGTLRLPIDRDVVLELSARDVIHSFWVPQFGQKQDAVPGEVTKLVITPSKLGEFPVICTELCGLGHSVMRTQAIVMERGEYENWVREAGQDLAGPPGQAGAAVFENQGCGSCHTFEPAGSTGDVGPSLDDLSGDAASVRESIVDPDATITPGYQAGVMPKTFGDLPDYQLDALVQYLLGENQ